MISEINDGEIEDINILDDYQYIEMKKSLDTVYDNFIENNKSAISYQRFLSKIKSFKIKYNLPIRRNVWDGNYWDEPRSLPYMIPGVLLKFTFQVDWHPAQKPYDISGMR